jgi:hypothetical protein
MINHHAHGLAQACVVEPAIKRPVALTGTLFSSVVIQQHDL